jgi:hypothetical protein
LIVKKNFNQIKKKKSDKDYGQMFEIYIFKKDIGSYIGNIEKTEKTQENIF